MMAQLRGGAGSEREFGHCWSTRAPGTNSVRREHDVYYRVHVQRYGWMAWTKNGEEAGTQGMSRRVEAIQVVLVAEDGPAPRLPSPGARPRRTAPGGLLRRPFTSGMGVSVWIFGLRKYGAAFSAP